MLRVTFFPRKFVNVAFPIYLPLLPAFSRELFCVCGIWRGPLVHMRRVRALYG